MFSGSTSLAASERVRAWLIATADIKTAADIAKEAGVDDKIVRNVRNGARWNPTVETLSRLESVMPRNWRPRRSAA